MLGVVGALGLTITTGGLRAQQAGDPAAVRFDFAHHVLRSADTTRAAGDRAGALMLYEEAYRMYQELVPLYPAWEPAVTRFRAEYCRQEAAILRAQLAAEAPPALEDPASTAMPSMDPTDPAVPAEPPTPATAAATGTVLRMTPVALSSDSAALTLAAGHLREGQAEAARDILLAALREHPDDPRARLLIGVAQCMLGRYEDALYVLETLVQDIPDNVSALLALSAAQAGMRDYLPARATLDRALVLAPESPEAHENMARLLMLTEPPETDAARAHYERARALGLAPDAGLEALWTPSDAGPDQ